MKKLFVAAISLATLGFAGTACATPIVYQFTGIIDSFDMSVPAFTGNVGDTYAGTLTLDTDPVIPAGGDCRSRGMSYDATIGGLNFAYVSGGLNIHCTGSPSPNDLYFLDEVTVGPNPFGLEFVEISLNFSSSLGGPTFSSDLPVDDFLGGYFRMLGNAPVSDTQIREMRTHIVSLTRVPEPSSYLLLGLGLGGLFLQRRRTAR